MEDGVTPRDQRGSGLSGRSLRPSTRDKMAVLAHALERLPGQIAANPRAGAIHRLRTTVRRIEALLSRAGEESGRAERKLLKQLARIRRRAGKVRDLDIQMKALASLKLDAVAREKDRVLHALKKARARRRSQLVLVLEDETAGLEKRLRRLAARLAHTPRNRPAGSTSEARHDERSLLNIALGQFARLVHAHGALTEEHLHDFRLQTKRLRYLAEAAGRSLAARAAIDQLKRIQDAIGDWHDWLTLMHTAERVLGSPESPLLAALRRKTRARFLKALRVTADAKEHLAELRRPLARRPPRSVVPSRSSPRLKGAGASALAALRSTIGGLPSPLAALHGDGHIRRS